MAITAAEIVFRYSVKTGSAGDTTAQATPTHATTGSLGKYVSTTAWAGGTNSLFDNITGDENAASTVDYRCFFVLNAHGTLTLENAVIYVSAEQAGGASVAIALDSTAISLKGATPAQALEIANETTAPAGPLTFSTPTTKAGGLVIGNLAPNQVKAIWVRRTAANTAALNADNFTVTVAGDTAA
jgi:hypothetical protein